VTATDRQRRFELMALPHLDAAYNLARWLTGNPADAEDVVQTAYLRAFRYFEAWRGGDLRVWLLAIVRTSFVDWARENRSARLVFRAEPTDEAGEALPPLWTEPTRDPEAQVLGTLDGQSLATLIQSLSPEYREVLILREMEDMSYKQIAAVAGVPIGTVMSRLARARAELRRAWLAQEPA